MLIIFPLAAYTEVFTFIYVINVDHLLGKFTNHYKVLTLETLSGVEKKVVPKIKATDKSTLHLPFLQDPNHRRSLRG